MARCASFARYSSKTAWAFAMVDGHAQRISTFTNTTIMGIAFSPGDVLHFVLGGEVYRILEVPPQQAPTMPDMLRFFGPASAHDLEAAVQQLRHAGAPLDTKSVCRAAHCVARCS